MEICRQTASELWVGEKHKHASNSGLLHYHYCNSGPEGTDNLSGYESIEGNFHDTTFIKYIFTVLACAIKRHCLGFSEIFMFLANLGFFQ